MTALFTIRPAQIVEASSLRALAIRTFRDTFTEGSQPADMEAYLQTAFSLARTRSELSDPNNIFLLLFPDGETLPYGYTKLRIGTVEPSVRGDLPIELERLYVDKSVLRQGFGSVLMKAAIAKSAELAYDTLWLGVWEHNYRAIAFYKRWGFKQVGAHPFVLGSDHQTDLIFQRPVKESRSV